MSPQMHLARVQAACWNTALIGLILATSACGYRLERPSLPGGERRLAVGQVINRTDVGLLDLRLRSALRDRLGTLENIELSAPERSAWILEVSLDRCAITRDPSTSKYTYLLQGSFSLRDPQGKRKQGPWKLSSTGTQSGVNQVETPAVRHKGLQQAVDGFAAAITQQLFSQVNPAEFWQ